MLYPQNQSETLETSLFTNPTSEYRGAPFWAWNTKLQEEEIREQIGYFQEMGMGGFHVHVRTGLDTPYLSDEYISRVADALDEAKNREMLLWLYDEDRWPSGSAGGMVTQNPDYVQRRLLFTAYPKEAELWTRGMHLQHDTFYEVARYRVVLNKGFLVSYERVPADQPADWYAYLTLQPRSAWFNNQSYVNTLDRRAIEQFIQLTHEKYEKAFGKEFSAAIPAIFTDEPQFAQKETLTLCDQKQEIRIPFADDLEETYQNTYGDSLLAHLPEIFWEWQDGGVSITRYRYHDHVAERFSQAFADTVGSWCREHHIMLTGHMMQEASLGSQTGMLGEAMRSYRGFQLPGIDMLCDHREYSTAKQAQSASHQFGRPGVLSELYGVTNWDFDFRGHKLQGDWQAALGVTTRVHHLTWMSMAGEAKRDYPACIGYQSPWYREYKLVEDHFARLNTALTRGKARVRIGMIHPIESYWLYYGSNEKTGLIRAELEENFKNSIEWLLFDCLDFDFICESLLPQQSKVEEVPMLTVGAMRYDVVLVPALHTIRGTTLDRLEAFCRAGGKLIFMGDAPGYVDARPSERAIRLREQAESVSFTRGRLLAALDPYRDVEILSLKNGKTPRGILSAGDHTNHLLYQMRDDHGKRWLFIAHGTTMMDPDQPHEEWIEIRLPGIWNAEEYHTLDGTVQEKPVEYHDGSTWCRHAFYEHDSLLLCLTPGEGHESVKEEESERLLCTIPVPNEVPVTLSEDNVLVLDMAEYRMDDGEWMPREEILRLDNEIRTQAGYPLRKKEVAQPWLLQEVPRAEHEVRLRFTIHSEIDLTGAKLAMENRQISKVYLDGQSVATDPVGFYVDRSIETIALPSVHAGKHILEIVIPFHQKVNLEWYYILGDFGVRVHGSECVITPPVRKLAFSDWSDQGLPFYGGNVIYRIPLELSQDGAVRVQATQFRNPLWKARIDEGDWVPAPFAPYTAEMNAQKGHHILEVTAYGNRINSFGQLHNCDETMDWFGADSWRTEGTAWSYEYHLHRMGFLKRVEIGIYGK